MNITVLEIHIKYFHYQLHKLFTSFFMVLDHYILGVDFIVASIFIDWAYYLFCNCCFCRVTVKLRYYPKDFVQEFMAEALSFLLRNPSTEQLIKGIVRRIFESAIFVDMHKFVTWILLLTLLTLNLIQCAFLLVRKLYFNILVFC